MKQKILLVDDRPENILVLESTLDDEKFEFIKAGSGEEALRQLLRNEISLILLDVQMPGMDGFETAGFIRGNPKTMHIPIIFISAISKEQKHIFKGYQSGAVDYMFKPFDPDILRSKVNILLELDRHRRMVEQQNKKLTRAQNTTDGILKNVKEGLFLLDDKSCVSAQYSQALENILGMTDLAGKNLMQILKDKIPKKAFSATPEFLELSFDVGISDASLEDLNPLEDIEYEFVPDGETNKIQKYLSFDCRRIYEDEYISALIFTVTDNTQKIVMQKKVEEMEKESRRQLDSLLGIIHVDPKLLKDFVESVERDIVVAEQKIIQLKKSSKKDEILDFLYRCMHQIKGNAAILDLKLFMDEAHKAEDCINQLKSNASGKKCHIDYFSERLANIKTGIEEINQLISKLSHIYKYFRPKRRYEIELLIRAVQNLISNLKGSTGKNAELIYNNFDAVNIPYNCRLDLKDILVQLTRNAFHHGIETKEERIKAKKDPVGKITIETQKTEDSIGFSYRDDGRGLRVDKIRQAALDCGKWTAKEIETWNEQKIIESIFQSGVTTVTKATTSAGRGVGMDIISQMVTKLGGTISVEFETGKYTEFKILFPVKA